MWAMAMPVLTFDLVGAWTRARERAGLKQDALAALMGIAGHQLADQLAGRGHLSLQRILLLLADPEGRVFLRYLAEEVSEASGLDFAELELVARFETAMHRVVNRMQRRVPVKADLRVIAKKESA